MPGSYCGACGQRAEQVVHSLGHFLREAGEGLTHADSRLWGTLIPLIARPGFLTCEFLAGRRVRYLPPVRLYLVLSLLFFLLAGLERSAPTVLRIELGGGRAQISQVRTPAGDADLAEVEQECSRLFAGALMSEKLRAACPALLSDNGRSFRAAFLHNVPRAMFVFLPLIALVMKALYRHPQRFYVEHLLFLLHNHAFVFLLFGLTGLASFAPWPLLSALLSLPAMAYTAWYVFLAMRRVYGEGRARTGAKFVVIALTYGVCAIIVLAVTSLYSLEALSPGAG